MSASLTLTQSFSVTLDGEAKSRTLEKVLTIEDSKWSEQHYEIPVSTTVDPLDVTDADSPLNGESAPAMAFLWIECLSANDDQTVFVEITIDKGNDVGIEQITLALPVDTAIVLTKPRGYANYTADFAGGTVDDIESVRVRNTSGVSTAKVRVIAAPEA